MSQTSPNRKRSKENTKPPRLNRMEVKKSSSKLFEPLTSGGYQNGFNRWDLNHEQNVQWGKDEGGRGLGNMVAIIKLVT